jgi:mono/diheme cytochrome c family protein
MAAIIVGASPGAAQDAALYTTPQAGQGAALYARQCAACHGADVEGGTGPALKGPAFTEMAAGQHLTAKSLLDRISSSMPMTAPGSLKPEDYAALMAFLLQQSGYPAGSRPLSQDDANLASLDLGKNSSGKPSQPAALRLASSGVYTDAQVARGKQFYADTCAQCHGGDANGGEEGPPLVGPSFMARWGALPVGAVHAFIDKNMPPGNAGALGAVQESDIVSFLLWKNGFASGPTALPADPVGLNGIGWK